MAVHDFAAIAHEIRKSHAQCGNVRVISIDGPAGSGKTTLAARLSIELGNCPIVHMDDVYDGWFQDFESELGQRLQKEILEPLSAGETAGYNRYDWYESAFTDVVDIPAHDYLILEGVGSSNSVIAELISYSIWIEANPELLIDRIIDRDGEEMRPHLDGFKVREAQYFENQNIKARANLQLSGD